MSLFTGSGTAIVTPFYANGGVNYDKLEEIIDWQIKNKTDAIIVCGTTGEAATMNDTEHLECIRVAVSATSGRVPVIAGTGSNDTAHGIKLSQEAQKLKADALLQVTPYYNKTTQQGLIAHFTAIAQAVDIPVMLYNVPSRTGMNIAASTARELALSCRNIVAVKEASGDISHAAELAYQTDGLLDIYSGNDDQILPLMSLGAKGVVSVASNIMPAEIHDMVMLYLDKKTEEACRLQLKLLPLVHLLFCETNPIPVKAAMNLMGMEVGPLRLPLIEMSEANKEKLAATMKELGLIK
ncbi:4-hydroxy-tetrahydrodipicolinate synthase [Lachnospiraceae bacterium oral taxon 500]|nr:4-hydroxy-tetrahydrodipicolinate synthase [Lachnospiraceae bacterium oral taxon 500]